MKDFKEKNNISLNAPSPYSVDFFKTLREKYIGRYSEKDAAKRLTERIAKKELTPEEKKALENTRYRSFLTEYFVNTLARPAIADVLPTKEDRGAFYGLVPTDGNDILRADGVKSVAYGPNIRRNDDKSWLDLSNFDLEKNSKINLVAHTNNGYETSFTVDVKDITYINPNKELKINLVNLYKKTSSAISKGYLKNRMSA